MNYSIYDAIELIDKNFEKNSNEYKNTLIKVAISLDNGHLIETILDALKDKNFDYLDRLANTLNENYEECNLIIFGKFYYHNELRIKNEHTKYYFDINKGIIEKIEQEYFLEMKASYTLIDLMNYISKKNKNYQFIYDFIDEASIKGCLKWLITTYGIEKVLFMIDVSHDIISFNGLNPIKLIDIKEYLVKAEELRSIKKNTSVINGVDKIVPRKRK